MGSRESNQMVATLLFTSMHVLKPSSHLATEILDDTIGMRNGQGYRSPVKNRSSCLEVILQVHTDLVMSL